MIDGATRPQQFRFVTWPLLRPTTFLLLILNVIHSFQVFDLIFVMTGGGPGFSTTMIVQYIYQSAFASSEMGYASAMGIVLFLMILLVHTFAMACEPAHRALRLRRTPMMVTTTSPARQRIETFALWALLAAGALIMIFPIYWMFATAIRPKDQIFSGQYRSPPDRLGLEKLRRCRSNHMPFLHWSWNSTWSSRSWLW